MTYKYKIKDENLDGKNFGFLIGKSIEKVECDKMIDDIDWGITEKYILTCNDGTIIKITTNDGCGGCSNGWSSFKDLQRLEYNNNIITDVRTRYKGDEFTMFIYYEDGRINELKGDDGYGNGYYGGGFYVTIMEVCNE